VKQIQINRVLTRLFESNFWKKTNGIDSVNAPHSDATRRDLESKVFIKKDPNRVLNVLILSLTDLSCCIYPLDYIDSK